MDRKVKFFRGFKQWQKSKPRQCSSEHAFLETEPGMWVEKGRKDEA